MVILLELSLRFFQYGDELELFTTYEPNKEFLVANPHASKRYFIDSSFAPTGNRELFKKEKTPNTLRFFVLGESTTVGYPYFHNGSFHRWLLFRLMYTYPEKHFEIINLSLTAVNSYTTLGFAKELAGYEPDAVLVYTGQNEYYGGLGVASAQTIGGSPAMVNGLLRLRDLRIVQLLLDSYKKITGLFPVHKKDDNTEKTRMEVMVGNQLIPYQSTLYEKGLKQFRYNMDATLQVLSQNKIPIFVSNLVSNIKDIPPFIGESGADSVYSAGQTLWASGKYEEAKAHFLKAKELDELRFRAPDELNDIIGELCVKYPRAYMVDTKKEMEEYAPHNILGEELFTDHVHPNLKGYAFMANAFYKAMKESGILPKAHKEMTIETLLQEMPISPTDSISGEFRIMRLRSHWPYNDKRFDRPIPENTVEEKLAARLFRKEESWLAIQNTLYTAYNKTDQPGKAAKIAEGVVLEYPEDPAFYDKAFMDYGKSGEIRKAALYLQKSFQLSASFEKARYLFVYYLMLDEPLEALPYLNYAISTNVGQLKLTPIKPLVEEVIVLKQKLSANLQDTKILSEIAALYLKMDNRTVALQYAEKVLAAEPRNPAALQIKEQVK